MALDGRRHTAFHSELSDPRTLLFSFTVGQYHKLLRSQIILEGEPYELLDGQVVRKDRSAQGENPITVARGHALTVMALGELNSKLQRLGCHMRCQQPITIPPRSEPEPDGVIARGTLHDYSESHPLANEILCVIEVADASSRRDRTTKLRIYAKAGIAKYVIIDLPDRLVAVYDYVDMAKGTYEPATILGPGQSVLFPTASGRGLSVPVRDLLPPEKNHQGRKKSDKI